MNSVLWPASTSTGLHFCEERARDQRSPPLIEVRSTPGKPPRFDEQLGRHSGGHQHGGDESGAELVGASVHRPLR
ncbi:hypothetical protein ACWDWU_30130 [Streptomyces sp. NPDC003442]